MTSDCVRDPAPVVPDITLSRQQRRANLLSNAYYDQTLQDYRHHWRLDRHLGMHCGFHDEKHSRFDDAVANMNCQLASAAGVEAGDVVLDAGCGIGGSAIWLAENLQAKVCGITINARQVDVARSLCERRSVANRVSILLLDFTASGLPSESFDVVWALESSCYAVDRGEFFAEAFRLLRPGGRLVVGDLFLDRAPTGDRAQAVVRRWCDAWAVPSLVTGPEARRLLVEAGWDQIKLRDISAHVIPSSNRMLRLSLTYWPLGMLARALRLRTALQTRAIFAGFDQYWLRKNQWISYLVVTATKPHVT